MARSILIRHICMAVISSDWAYIISEKLVSFLCLSGCWLACSSTLFVYITHHSWILPSYLSKFQSCLYFATSKLPSSLCFAPCHPVFVLLHVLSALHFPWSMFHFVPVSLSSQMWTKNTWQRQQLRLKKLRYISHKI